MCGNQPREDKTRFQFKNAVKIIKESREINRYKLAFMLGMSPRNYRENFHPMLAEAFDNKIEYNEETKNWISLEKEKK